MKAEEQEVDDSAYIQARDSIKLSDAYFEYLGWTI